MRAVYSICIKGKYTVNKADNGINISIKNIKLLPKRKF